jgi:hypothetical protein
MGDHREGISLMSQIHSGHNDGWNLAKDVWRQSQMAFRIGCLTASRRCALNEFDSLIGNHAIRMYQFVSSLHELVFVSNGISYWLFNR